ncbi:MAG: KH domain-containing protein [Thermoplasmatales archaeon]|nr:KH domain-containing protein [Thermoplasmatales archaeon]
MEILKIPKERVGVLIGKNGEVKERIEKKSGIKILIDSENGEVTIEGGSADPLAELKVINIVRAVGRGFSPENAFKLFSDEYYLELVNIKDYAKTQKHITRLRARVIGSKGKTRKIIEGLSGARVSVYGNSVSIIGDVEQVQIARKAVDMLLSGSEHSVVYRYLERMRKETF